MLELCRIRKVYSGIPAVEEVSKMVTGLIEPTGGEVLFDGKPILDDLMVFRQRVGYVPEEPHFYTHLSVMEYLVMVSQLRGMPAFAGINSHRLLMRPAASRLTNFLIPTVGRADNYQRVGLTAFGTYPNSPG